MSQSFLSTVLFLHQRAEGEAEEWRVCVYCGSSGPPLYTDTHSMCVIASSMMVSDQWSTTARCRTTWSAGSV